MNPHHPSPHHIPFSSMAALDFQDLLPEIAHKLGGQALLVELCNGFRLLMDRSKCLITLDSLRTNSALLGLQDLTHDDLLCMIAEADLDGDGALSLLEFCVLMFRLSPDLMQHSSFWLHQPLPPNLPNSSSSSSPPYSPM